MTKIGGTVVLALLLLSIPGCGGGLRYSQVAPEAKDFHPRRVAVLPADTTAFPEAKGAIDRLFAEALSERKWFTAVVGGEEIGRRLKTDAELRQVTEDYLAKREKVSFSDPALSGRIGALTDTEALLLVRVDYWNYTTENDKKVGKVSLSIDDDRSPDGQDPLDGCPPKDKRLYDHQTGPPRCGKGSDPGDDRLYAALAFGR